jgi:hypothetical protein
MSFCASLGDFMPLGFFIAWLLANNLLHLDNKTLALFDMSDLQIRSMRFKNITRSKKKYGKSTQNKDF